VTGLRVVVVDDQALVRAGFRMIVESEPDMAVVGEAGDGTDAIDEVARTRPDVVLMDVRMPTLDGIEATRRILAEHAEARRRGDVLDGPPRVLVLTTFDLDEYVFDAVRAGASGFLLKDTPPEELVHAIRVVARGDALLAPSVTRRLVEEFARRPMSTAPDEATLGSLTDREREVLVLIARGLSNMEIAAHLVVSEATVKTHVGHVLTKLGVRDRVQAVVLAYEAGLVVPGGA
jgi:DNA-binding NarL/FixJ family response regulator